jgi:YfiH family protein
MQPLIQREFHGRTARIAHSTRSDGDLSPSTVPADVLIQRRQAAVALPWCVARQVHSDRAIAAAPADAAKERPVGDALVTNKTNLVLAVHSGDCVPVGFITDSATVAAAHAGWKGLEAGVLESTVRRLREFGGAAAITAAVGPHIRASHYEFGQADLDRLARRFGPDVIGATNDGRPALDLTAAIAAELNRLGVDIAKWSDDCTAGEADLYWSHRDRQESGRIALVAWIAPADETEDSR